MENDEIIREIKWPSTPPPVPEDKNLRPVLESFIKDDLDLMRSTLEIKGARRLRKGELIERIAQELPGKLNNILASFDEERLDILENLRNNKGIIRADRISYNKVIHFIYNCIAFPGLIGGKRVLFMPEEVKDFFKGNPLKPIRERAKKITEIINLTIGMLNYYGVIDLGTLEIKLEKYIELTFRGNELFKILNDAVFYHIRLSYRDRLFVEGGVINPGDIWLEQLRRPDLGYYPFTYQDLWKASGIQHVDITPQAQEFLYCLKQHYSFSHDEAMDLYYEFQFEVLNNTPLSQAQQIILNKVNFNTMEEAEKFVPVMMEMYNHMRQWVLKGYTPHEVFVKFDKPRLTPLPDKPFTPQKGKKKTGRNDPCPCGSGKKYKKCCQI